MNFDPPHEDDVVVMPIEDEFDLHHFAPRERLEMLDAYLDAAQRKGFGEVRIVHGRGRGVARAEVRSFLDHDPRVRSAVEAEPGRGGWGATLVQFSVEDAAAMECQPVFVGDIQGCAVELDALLARVERAFGAEYRLYVAGDAINRGDENLRVLERIRARVDAGLGEMVLGNHEIHLLRVALGLIKLDDTHTFHDVLESAECEDWVAWLLQRPLAAHGTIGGQRWVMVHASVHPDWSWADVVRQARRVEARLASGDDETVRALLDQRPGETPRRGSRRDVLGRFTCARSVRGARSRWSSRVSADPEERAWHEVWRERGHDYGVVYGHWATQGLNVTEGLRGLDSGCIHHGRRGVGYLSAWLPGQEVADASVADVPPGADLSRTFGATDADIWQVRARYRRVRVDV